ncbi:MAG: hypothetical protein U1E83_04380 [Methylotetracoccus sp.]
MALTLAACGTTRPEANPSSDYKVTAQVVDSRTGKPVPEHKPVARPRPSPAILDKLGLEPNPPTPEAIVPPEGGATEPRPLEPDPIPPPVAEPSPPPEPQFTPDEEFLLRVAREHPIIPVEGTINGELVVANVVNSDAVCALIAVSSPARSFSEIWRVCQKGPIELHRGAEPLPPIPRGAELDAAQQMTVNMAYEGGEAAMPLGDYRITARTMTPKDERGCALVRSALLWRGIALDIKDVAACQQPE